MELYLLKLQNAYLLELGKFAFKSENDLLPCSIGNYFEVDNCAEQHSHFMRSVGDNIAPRIKSRTTSGEKSIQYRNSHLWADIPSEIKSYESLNSFKKHYKKFLIGQKSES